jgi:hypothetical protein
VRYSHQGNGRKGCWRDGIDLQGRLALFDNEHRPNRCKPLKIAVVESDPTLKCSVTFTDEFAYLRDESPDLCAPRSYVLSPQDFGRTQLRADRRKSPRWRSGSPAGGRDARVLRGIPGKWSVGLIM